MWKYQKKYVANGEVYVRLMDLPGFTSSLVIAAKMDEAFPAQLYVLNPNTLEEYKDKA